MYREFAFGKYDYINKLIEEARCEQPMKEVLHQINDLLFHRTWPYEIVKHAR